ncbi:hypothetical protein BC629DRAFT_1504956 [Irpex lacteus]|nr:hypothetical protein BC629DRAFT_1504956 [Irpex lacteus]
MMIDTSPYMRVKVKFDNPLWAKFVSRAARDVCQKLGVNIEASRPRCELYKLLLYETGSHFLPHVDTEKQDGMFATIVIVLPSRFTGGAAHLTHSGLSATYDCSANSHYETNVLAWYTDVTHEIKPITSGYRLALSYNLIHTTRSLRPSLSTKLEHLLKLRRILKTWMKDEGQQTPEKIIYMLDHTYSQANLCASALKGADAHQVALLSPVAKDLGFQLGLATVELHQWGRYEDDGRDYRRYKGYHDPDSDGGDSDLTFEADGDVDKEISITHFVDLQGRLISDSLDFEDETETIPSCMSDMLENGELFKQESEGYQGNYAGDLNRWYRCSVLVIWPNWSSEIQLYEGQKGLKRALEDVKSITSLKPSRGDRDTVRFILSRVSSSPGKSREIVLTVCALARKWRKPRLWDRAVWDCCKSDGLSLLPEEEIFAAIQCFGVRAIQVSLELLVHRDSGNASRLYFLQRLELWYTTIPDSDPDKAFIERWIKHDLAPMARTLKKPTKAEIPFFLSMAKANGGVDCIRDHLLSRFLDLADAEFLKEFARNIWSDVEFPICDAKTAVVHSLLKAAISRTTFTSSNTPGYTSTANRLLLVKSYIQAARSVGSIGLVDAILDRVMDLDGLAPSQARDYARRVMLPLVVFLSPREAGRPAAPQEIPPKFGLLQETAIKLYLDALLADPNILTSPGEAETLLDAALADNSGKLFLDTAWPCIQKLKPTGVALQLLVTQMTARRDVVVSSGDYPNLAPTWQAKIAELAKHAVAHIDLSSARQILDALDWSIEMNVFDLYDEVLKRTLSPSVAGRRYIEDVLVPLVPDLRQWGIKHGRSMDSTLRKIVVIWKEKVLGASDPAIADRLNELKIKWTCYCEWCRGVRNFIVNPNETATQEPLGFKGCKHVDTYLGLYARGLVTWTKVKSTKPHSLSIKKTEALKKQNHWQASQVHGYALLKSLGADQNEVRRILGPVHDRLKVALEGGRPSIHPPTPRLS